MSGDYSIRAQMLQRSARLASGEHSEEAWYIVNLFQRTQPRELLQICHHILATFLELNYEYFDEGWPLISRLDVGALEHPLTGSYRNRLLRRRRSGRFRSRSPPKSTCTQIRHIVEDLKPPPPSPCQPEIISGETEAPVFVTPNRHFKLGWFRGRTTASFAQLLPSKPTLMLTPTSINLASPVPTSIEQVLRIGKSPAFTLQRSPRRSPDQLFPWEDSGKNSLPSSSENLDYILCRYIIDFMLDSPEFLSTEGLFRRPGSLSRTKHLHSQLKENLVSGYLSISQPSPPQNASCLDSPDISQRRTDVYCLLGSAPAYDIASLLLRCLATHDGLIHPGAADLFFQATQLQYLLTDQRPVYSLHPSDDWIHLLCHGRQLLAYRIIIQLMLPPPERQLLLKLLSLLHKIASNTQKTRMSAEALARCLAVAVFGSPDITERMGWYIDTLINLIELYEELETLPSLVYQEVRACLRSKLGHSPLRPVSEISSSSIDSAIIKRSWATCQISMDMGTRCTPTIPQTVSSNRLFETGSMNKENRHFLLTHLCMWTKSDDEPSQKPKSPIKKGEEHRNVKATSPFLVWKKQRSIGKSKASQDDVHPDHKPKKANLTNK